MERMIATRAFSYDGARVEPGEQFFAKDGHVPFLTKTRRADRYSVSAATYERRDMRAAIQPDRVLPGCEIDDLRAQYETKVGKKPDRRWKEARLRVELDNA